MCQLKKRFALMCQHSSNTLGSCPVVFLYIPDVKTVVLFCRISAGTSTHWEMLWTRSETNPPGGVWPSCRTNSTLKNRTPNTSDTVTMTNVYRVCSFLRELALSCVTGAAHPGWRLVEKRSRVCPLQWWSSRRRPETTRVFQPPTSKSWLWPISWSWSTWAPSTWGGSRRSR